jgi:hypothetical protein
MARQYEDPVKTVSRNAERAARQAENKRQDIKADFAEARRGRRAI